MREILFRGKRLDNGEWVEGFYISDLAGKAYICQKVTAMYTFDGARCYGPYIEVDPDTVGRETGLTDRNGKRIFEGDIVVIHSDIGDGIYHFIVAFGPCGGVKNVEHQVGYMGFHFVPKDWGLRTDPLYWISEYGVEVIGNVTDNPELLERGRE